MIWPNLTWPDQEQSKNTKIRRNFTWLLSNIQKTSRSDLTQPKTTTEHPDLTSIIQRISRPVLTWPANNVQRTLRSGLTWSVLVSNIQGTLRPDVMLPDLISNIQRTSRLGLVRPDLIWSYLIWSDVTRNNQRTPWPSLTCPPKSDLTWSITFEEHQNLT